MHRSLPALIALLLLALVAAPAGAAIFPGDPVIGPSGSVRSLGGINLAPDGSGALIATVREDGVDRVVVSRLVNGAWTAPERLDGGLAGPSSQPAVAAADGGRVVAVFANGGNIYAVTRASASASWVRQTLWSGGGASNPHVDISVNGKAYAVFAAPGAGGHDVRFAHARNGGSWTVVGAPLDANPARDAGAGAGRPRVAASADGVGIVVWGEGGRVIARRVAGTRPSIVAVDAIDGLTLEGLRAIGGDSPVVSTQDDDSFTGVAFRATFDVGGGTLRSRAVFRRLRGSRFETPSAVDSAPFSSGQASALPQISTVGTGQGLVVAGNETTFSTSALMLLFDIAPSTVVPISTVASTAPSYAVPAAATARKMLVAWQLTTAGGAPVIRARYRDGGDFEGELTLSRPELGPTAAADGLHASGDDSGNIAVAWVQDVPGQGRAVVVGTVDQPPPRFGVRAIKGWQRTARPLFSWSLPREQWGRYFRVTVDGVELATTGASRWRPRAPLAQGVRRWQVTALDRRGQSYAARPSTVRIDSVGPFVQARLTGALRAAASLRLTAQISDTPTGTARKVPGVATSGVREVTVDWGDGRAPERIRRGSRHTYARAGRYTLRITATDRAGNRTVVRRTLRVGSASAGGGGRRGARALVLRSRPPRDVVLPSRVGRARR